MINLKGAAVAAVITLAFAGAASAQVTPGVAGSPGRGNSATTTTMPNGAQMSNGQTTEPRMMRGRKAMRSTKMKRSRKMRAM